MTLTRVYCSGRDQRLDEYGAAATIDLNSPAIGEL
jgi:hypothetical protein